MSAPSRASLCVAGAVVALVGLAAAPLQVGPLSGLWIPLGLGLVLMLGGVLRGGGSPLPGGRARTPSSNRRRVMP